MDKNLFLKDYFKKLEKLLNFSEEDFKKIISVSDLIKEAHKQKKKTLILVTVEVLQLPAILVSI